MRRFVLVMNALYRVCVWVAGTALVVMTLVVPWGVFARYVLGRGSSWPEPLAVMMMVVFTFFGAAAAYRVDGHIAVALITERLPLPTRRAAVLLTQTMLAAIALFMLVWGARLCATVWGQSLSELPWLSVGVSYLPLPLSGLVTLLFIAERALTAAVHISPAGTQEPA
jgi:TRAP-type C4-dicarboxylate transport system permease small subunit